MMKEKKLTKEQESVVLSKKKKTVVSASAGSGKTFVVVEKLIKLICEEKVPVSKLLVLTFTKAAANELKNRLFVEILNEPSSPFLTEQLDEIMISDISTIDSFCEKIIKRNINKLSLPQNFAVLDEKNAKKLKKIAFKRTLEIISKEKEEKFKEIYFAFKRNSDLLEECIQSIQSFFDSQADSDKLVEDFSHNLSVYNEKALSILKEKFERAFSESRHVLKEAMLELESGQEKVGKSFSNFEEDMAVILNVEFSKDFYTICKELAIKKIPALPRAKCDEAVKQKLSYSKDLIKECYEIAGQLQFVNDELEEMAKRGGISSQLMEFYCDYAGQYKILKEKRYALDFADLEKLAKVLIEDDEVKQSLSERYEYIIIDEYQDTNKLQESILKPIAEGGYFIAVGDIKQGIYGFRNASKEIMSEDIAQFSQIPDGEALFLRGNFRTDNRILNFINSIFEKLMTSQSVGIDYKKTSILRGLSEFLPNLLPAITVDVINCEDEKEESDGDVWKSVYSVKEDCLSNNYKFKAEVLTIASRIEQLLQEKIYSPKTKQFRQVEMGDIALLFRNRSPLMQECVEFLQEKGFSVNADIKENLLEDSQISLIVSLLKLTINLNDDIALASVMCSPFGEFSIEELSLIRKKHQEGTFYEILKIEKESEETEGNCFKQQIEKFFDMIDEFKFNVSVYGIVKALEKLFDKSNFVQYLKPFDDFSAKMSRINRLFGLIKSNNLDFSVQEVISMLEDNQKEDKLVSENGNALTITTIHSTKGLEYPIVIICGAGESLSKVYNKQFVVSEKLGLGSYLYDFDKDLKLPSPCFIAGKIEKREREQVDELMLFYVAMTRAQNHLYIIGRGKESDFSFESLSKQNSYLKQIFFALGENFTSQLFAQEQIVAGDVVYNVVTEVEEKALIQAEKEENNYLFTKELEDFKNFEYSNKDFCKLSFKNSVTGISRLGFSDENDEQAYFDNSTADSIEERQKREKSVEIGNSYHEALKLIDFSEVFDLGSLDCQLKKISVHMCEGYAENIDKNILLKNILLIKSIVGESHLFKEREFIMESNPNELLNKDVCKEENLLIVQGIVDLFAVGEKIILIDYKFTSTKNEKILKERYGEQIRLYALALEKALGRKVDEKYLLSLKEGKLISLN